MRLADFLARSFRRSDARAVLAIAGLLLAAVGLQGLLLYAFIAVENLEEADRWMEHALTSFQTRARGGEPHGSIAQEMRASLDDLAPAVQIRDQDGAIVEAWGTWPAPDQWTSARRGDDPRGLASIGSLEATNHLVGKATLASGSRVELALPLTHFASEAAEVAQGIVLVTLGSGLIALFIAVLATANAFAPLRRTTLLLQTIDAHHLGQRLETRNTADPVDRHAETLNEVLAEIDAAFSRLRAFSSDVAHELRTPINRIVNVAEVALFDEDTESLQSALVSVQRTAEELSSIVESLLLLGEIGDDRFKLTRSKVQTGPWIARNVGIYEPLFEEAGVKLESSSATLELEADPVLLDRVLTNLLENALRHTPRGGRVEVRGIRAADGLCVHVDDSGPGVRPADRERIFDRFSRLDPRRSGPGSGLGLPLARAIARLHGGDLEVDDSPLGGARCVLRLPGSPVGKRVPDA